MYTRTTIKWDDSLCDEFRRGIIGRLPDLNSAINSLDTSDKSSVNSCVESFTQILNDVAMPLFSSSKTYKKSSSSNCYNNRLCNKSEWFDEELKTANNYIMHLYIRLTVSSLTKIGKTCVF